MKRIQSRSYGGPETMKLEELRALGTGKGEVAVKSKPVPVKAGTTRRGGSKNRSAWLQAP